MFVDYLSEKKTETVSLSFLTFGLFGLFRKHTNRVMQTVRAANTTKRFPKAIKGGSRPIKGGQTKSGDKPFDFSFAASANSPRKNPPSMDDLRAAVRRLSISENGEYNKICMVYWSTKCLMTYSHLNQYGYVYLVVFCNVLFTLML